MAASNELIYALNEDLQIAIPVSSSEEQLKNRLIVEINHLITQDFNKLLSILYRLDVSEAKLRYMLKEHSESDAATVIAALIIERQLQKLKSRQEYNQRDNAIDENEKW